MNSFLHADIFFVVTTTAVIAISVFIVIALVYVIKILKDVRGISKNVNSASGDFAEEVHSWRIVLKRLTMKKVFGSLLKIFRKQEK